MFGLALVGTAISYRVFAVVAEFGGIAFYAVTPSNLDALGFGSLLAMASRTMSLQTRLPSLMRAALVTGVVGLVVAANLKPTLAHIVGPTAISLVFGWLVGRAAGGFSGLAGRLLEAKPILYVGKISYGLYVYHVFVPPALEPLLTRTGIALAGNTLTSFAVYSLITLVIASASWTLFEHPINRLKRHFALDR